VTVSSLHNAVNPRVESGEEVEAVSELVGSSGVSVKALGFLGEEVGSESLVGVEEDSVDVVVELGGHVLGQELDLVDAVAGFSSTLGRLLGLLVVRLASIGHVSGLDLGHVEAGSEGVGGVVGAVEQISEAGGGEVLMLLVDFSEDDGAHAHGALEGGLLGVLLVRDLGHVGGDLGGVDESHDVGVVLEDQDLLVGCLVEGSRSDSNDGSLSDVGELELEGEGVESLSGVISELEFVGVLVELEDLEDLGDDVEVSLLLGSLLELDALVGSDVGGGEVVVGPLSEGGEDGDVLSLEGGLLSGEGVGGVVAGGLSEGGELISGEKSVGALVEHVDVELSLVLVDSHGGSVHSDNVSESVDDGEVLELGSVDDDGGVGALLVEGGVDNLEGADESVGVGLVGEGGINDDSVEVARVAGGQGGLGELDVLVLGGGLSRGSALVRGRFSSGFGHF